MWHHIVPKWLFLLLYGLSILEHGVSTQTLFPYPLCAALLFLAAGTIGGVRAYRERKHGVKYGGLCIPILILLSGICLMLGCHSHYDPLFMGAGFLAALSSGCYIAVSLLVRH